MASAATAANAQHSYAYRARSQDGKLVKGVLEVPTQAAAVSRLNSMGLAAVQLTEKLPGTGLEREISLGIFSKRIKITDLAVATRQLATMTASGLPLLRTVTIVAGQTGNEKLAGLLQEVARDVETGSAFSDSLARHPADIPPIMISMLRAGETGGFLDVALASIATTFEKEAKLRSTIKSAMTYPIVVLAIALIAVVAMLLFIVPIFKTMFENFGSSLPLPTQILVDISDQMVWLLPTAAVAAIVIATWWRAKKDTDAVRRIVHPLMLRIPIFGPLLGKVAISRFARNLANMTAAGVPLLRVLTIVGQTSGNWVIEQAAMKVAESVRLGGSMAGPLAEEKMFPTMAVQMVAVGEESGSVDTMLSKVADFYDDEIEATADALTSLIEPVLIAFLGIVVGGMVIALYMPIFSIATAVK